MNLLTVFLSGSIIDLDGTFFFQFALFWVAFLALRKLVFHPVLAVIEAREEAIEGARAKAKRLERESAARAKEFEAELHKVRVSAGSERDKLRQEAKHLEEAILTKVRAETDRQLADAQATMEQEAQKIRSAIGTEVPVLAKQIAAKLLEREVR